MHDEIAQQAAEDAENGARGADTDHVLAPPHADQARQQPGSQVQQGEPERAEHPLYQIPGLIQRQHVQADVKQAAMEEDRAQEAPGFAVEGQHAVVATPVDQNGRRNVAPVAGRDRQAEEGEHVQTDEHPRDVGARGGQGEGDQQRNDRSPRLGEESSVAVKSP